MLATCLCPCSKTRIYSHPSLVGIILVSHRNGECNTLEAKIMHFLHLLSEKMMLLESIPPLGLRDVLGLTV